ncbi:MAG: TonB-dependent receptor plug domain-containing protein [Terriglobales bacterium]
MKNSTRPVFSIPLFIFVLAPLLLSFFQRSILAQTLQADVGSENPLKQLTLEQLGNIQVTTASKAPEEVWKTPAAIYVITHEDIERSGATNIPEALRLAPGIEVARIDGDKWSIGIRGFGSRLARSVLVLIDGRTVYTTLFAGTYWEVQDTLIDDVDRIEVIRGPGGTIWGPNAVNGVINIITKQAKDTHGTLASVGGGNIKQGFANLRHGGGNGKNLDYRVYGKGFNRGPEYHSDHQNFDDWRGGQAGFRVDWSRNTKDNFTLQGDVYDIAAGESVQATSYTPPYSQILERDARLSGGNIMGRWTRTEGEGKDIQIQAYYDRVNRYEANLGDLRDTFDVDLLQRFRLVRQQISWGLGARIVPATDLEVVSGLTFQPAKRTDYLWTAFFQDEIALVKNRLSISLGSKLLRTNFSPIQLEPSVRLLYTPSDTQTFWAAFTHAVRTPSDVERDFFLSGYIGPGPGGLQFFARFNANRDFRSEQMNGYELGYRRLITKTVYVDIAGFYNHYSDLLSEDITGGPFLEDNPPPTHILLPAEFGNGLLGTTKGFEIAPEWRPTHFWRLRGSYSYLQMDIKPSRNSLDVGSAPGINGSSPKHEAMVQSGFDISKDFTLDLAYRYISALPGQKVQAYSTGDAVFGWRLSEHFRLSLVGNNLFQPQHAEDGGDPGPLVQIKRSAYAKITWQN